MIVRGLRGVHDAFTWLTVLPLPQPRGEFDRARGRTVIGAVPVVGLVLGGAAAALATGLAATSLPALLVGALVTAALALATRGMHVDGFADTVDGIGSYGDPERVRTIMRTGDVGPFGAAALALVMLMQSIAFGTLAADGRWLPIAVVVFISRATVPLACRRGLSAANRDGFGALVAGTQRISIALWAALAVAAAFVAMSVTGAVTAVVVFAVAWAFSAHACRRAGGLTGDILGGTIEVSTTLAAIGFLL